MSVINQPPGHTISYFPKLTPMTGSIKATILVQQITYLTKRGPGAEGWIYKEQHEWMDDTGLTLKELRLALDALETRNLIDRDYDRRNHQLRVRLRIEDYNKAIQELPSDEHEGRHVTKRHIPKGQMLKRHMPKGNMASSQKADEHVPKGNFVCSKEESLEKELREEPKEKDTPSPPKPNVMHERFDTFWKAYPRKEAKGRALKVWKQLKPSAEFLEVVLGAISRQRSSPQWIREHGKFIPHAATWLNDQRWEDENTEDLMPQTRQAISHDEVEM